AVAGLAIGADGREVRALEFLLVATVSREPEGGLEQEDLLEFAPLEVLVVVALEALLDRRLLPLASPCKRVVQEAARVDAVGPGQLGGAGSDDLLHVGDRVVEAVLWHLVAGVL